MPPTHSQIIAKPYAFLCCAIIGLFYAFEMLQFSLGSTLSAVLIKELHFNVYELNLFSSIFLYCCAFAIIPTGLLLDRVPLKPLFIIGLSLCILGVFLVAVSHNKYLIILGRGLSGLTSDFAFLGYFVMVSRYYQHKKAIWMKSLIYSWGAIGCILSQTPLKYFMNMVGWRPMLWIIFSIGLVLLIALIFFMQAPPQQPNKPAHASILKSLRTVTFNKLNLLSAIYGNLCNIPLMVLGALYGQLYLTKGLHYSSIEASNVNSIIFFGALIGPPIIGMLAARFKAYVLMAGLAVCSALLWLTLIVFNQDWSVMAIFFLFGILINSQLLSVLVINHINPSHIQATALSVLSIANNAGGALYQLCVSWLLLFNKPFTCTDSTCIYTLASFNQTFFVIALCYLAMALVICCSRLKSIVLHAEEVKAVGV